MGFKLNLTNEEIKKAESGFTPLPAGIYAATVYDAKEAVSKAGNDMYVLDFKITDGPEGVGRKIKSWFTVKADALFSLIALHKAVGFPYPDKNTPAGEFDFPDADEYLGKEVNIQITLEPYQSVDDDGEEVTLFRNNVKKVLTADPDKVSSADDVEEAASSGLFL